MIRDTSIQAYNRIRSEGLLSEKRFAVYDVLYKHGPMTGMELRAYMPKGFVDSQVRARLNELRGTGVVQEIGKRVCSVTGMLVILWEVTKRLPSKEPAVKKMKCKSCGGSGYENN